MTDVLFVIDATHPRLLETASSTRSNLALNASRMLSICFFFERTKQWSVAPTPELTCGRFG